MESSQDGNKQVPGVFSGPEGGWGWGRHLSQNASQVGRGRIETRVHGGGGGGGVGGGGLFFSSCGIGRRKMRSSIGGEKEGEKRWRKMEVKAENSGYPHGSSYPQKGKACSSAAARNICSVGQHLPSARLGTHRFINPHKAIKKSRWLVATGASQTVRLQSRAGSPIAAATSWNTSSGQDIGGARQALNDMLEQR